MAVEIYMPKNGMDMVEGTIVRWLKEIGDHVDKDEPVMEIETDKITMESESPAEGYLLAKYYEDGAVVPVLTTLGYVGEKGGESPRCSAQSGKCIHSRPRRCSSCSPRKRRIRPGRRV